MSTGLKIKRENFKALKDEIINIKSNINKEVSNAGVFMNEKEEYIWRGEKRKIFGKSSPEAKYEFNGILKYYELHKDKYKQGFTSKYFRKLTDLLSKIKYKKYSKERIDLFNSRIKQSQKKFNTYLKENGVDTEIKSTINKVISPFLTTLNFYNRNSDIKIQLRKKNQNKKYLSKNSFYTNNFHNFNSTFSSNDLSSFNHIDLDKKLSKIKNMNDFNTINNSNKKNYFDDIEGKKIFTKFNSYKNIIEYKNNRNNDNLTFSLNKTNNKNKKNDIDYSKINGKELFFKNYNEEKYHNYLRYKYNFYDSDEYLDKNSIKLDLIYKNRKRFNTPLPNKKIFQKSLNNNSSKFFRKLKREIKKENSQPKNLTNRNSHRINIRKKIKFTPSCQSQFLKTIKFNDDCHSIFDKYKKNLK